MACSKLRHPDSLRATTRKPPDHTEFAILRWYSECAPKQCGKVPLPLATSRRSDDHQSGPRKELVGRMGFLSESKIS